MSDLTAEEDTAGPARRWCIPIAVLLTLGFAAYLLLHLLEPRLALTWSYAHLGRRAILWWSGVALVPLLVASATWAWQSQALQRPLAPISPWLVLLACAAGWLVLAAIAHAFPAAWLSDDQRIFMNQVKGRVPVNPRWHLTVWSLRQLAAALAPFARAVTVASLANTLLATAALAGLAGAARSLGKTRGEAIAITLLCWSAFGTAQLTTVDADVYPAALALTALYAWTGLRTLRGTLHPAWPLAIAGVAPFFYIGLLLLAPSTVLIVVTVLQRPGGWRRLAVAAVVVILATGAATLPVFGTPFAFDAFQHSLVKHSFSGFGLSRASNLLPIDYVLTSAHAHEVWHTLLLVDGIGILLLVIAGPCGLERRRPTVFLILLLLPYLAYAVLMDPLFGAFIDWDLFSIGAVTTGLLGGAALIGYGRRCPRAVGPLLGLALACASIHLLARMNALDVSWKHHLEESPPHIQGWTPRHLR